MLHVRLLKRDGDAPRWIELGRMLRGMEAGVTYSDRALDQAVRVDQSLKEIADAIRAGGAAPAGTPTPDASPVASVAGDIPGKTWGTLTPERHKQAIEKLKAHAEEARTKYAPNLKLLETDYFLFYSDLDARESRNWASLLDKMYARLCEMFAIPKGTNIWHGKALVFVFKEADDFRRFEAEVYDVRNQWAAGLCHQFGSGEVHICFYRQADEHGFARILVHESVHGFIHRYRSPGRIANWVNEGLAEWIAYELVPQAGSKSVIRQSAASQLRTRPSLGGMLELDHIEPAHYVQTTAITDVLINDVSRKGYVSFVNAQKDGQTWAEAFDACFGVSIDKFLLVYAKSIGLTTPIQK
jgi:hypothetical protein